MNSHGNRARLGGVLVAVAAALALVALPGLASGHRGNGDDPAPAGTVQSFDPETGVLTIDLGEGGEISGLVVRRTHIRCDNGRHRGRHGLRHHKPRHGAAASRRGEDLGGRESDQSEDAPQDGAPEPGDDQSDRGPRAGDDQGDHGHDGHHHGRCGVDDLTEGATVKLATMVLIDGKAIYKLVALPAVQLPPVQGDEEEGEPEAPPAE